MGRSVAVSVAEGGALSISVVVAKGRACGILVVRITECGVDCGGVGSSAVWRVVYRSIGVVGRWSLCGISVLGRLLFNNSAEGVAFNSDAYRRIVCGLRLRLLVYSRALVEGEG